MAMNYKMTEDMIRCEICSAANGIHPDVYHTLPECKPTPVATEPCPACGNRNRCPSCQHHEGNPHDPNCPTLTCSEVVERLQGLAYHDNHYFDSGEALKILTEWRERRVQELEETLRPMIDIAKRYGQHSLSPEAVNGLIWVAERALANSEQIREGAKHESDL